MALQSKYRANRVVVGSGQTLNLFVTEGIVLSIIEEVALYSDNVVIIRFDSLSNDPIRMDPALHKEGLFFGQIIDKYPIKNIFIDNSSGSVPVTIDYIIVGKVYT